MEVSVVMPVYNRCAEMKKALDSLTSQTFKNFELIIIDDGSTDNISETLTMYQNTLNIKYTRVEHTGNLAFLRNLSISMSSGKYIAILDSDDWCHPDRLHIQHKYLENNKDVDVLATWVHIINECEKINSHFLEMLYNMKNDRSDIIIKCLNDGCCICNSTVMIRRNKFNELGGYDEKMIICEDFNLWLRALLKGFKFKILEKKLVFRKIHKNSVTRGYDGSSKAIRLVILNKLYYLL
ncbi:MAG TPA: glycosyltransferase family A protein, partial [Spirochaetota bacterium]|nr:glycosyltransferase family A protein [Spirochaetota bacterium]